MIGTKELAGAFAMDLEMVKEQTKGLTHADTVLQPPVNGNCMNWVLGHIVETRNLVLKQLGQPPILSEAQAKRYGYGSEPVCSDGADILKLETILTLLEQSQKTIEAALAKATPEELGKQVQSFMGTISMGHFVFVLYGHERYHLGQTELLRELALAPK